MGGWAGQRPETASRPSPLLPVPFFSTPFYNAGQTDNPPHTHTHRLTHTHTRKYTPKQIPSYTSIQTCTLSQKWFAYNCVQEGMCRHTHIHTHGNLLNESRVIRCLKEILTRSVRPLATAMVIVQTHKQDIGCLGLNCQDTVAWLEITRECSQLHTLCVCVCVCVSLCVG